MWLGVRVKGAQGETPRNRSGVKYCSTVCVGADTIAEKLVRMALRYERNGLDMTPVDERHDALGKVSAALNEYRLLVMRQTESGTDSVSGCRADSSSLSAEPGATHSYEVAGEESVCIRVVVAGMASAVCGVSRTYSR
jgi:hypothetical protein